MNWYIIAQSEEKWQRFPPKRQREFDFMHEPGYYRKATPFLDQEYAEQELDYNLYHVTTNLSGVIASERLKSRNELGGAAGLGGGAMNEAPHLISVTYDYNRARKIYEDLKLVCEVVRGQVPAHTIYDFVVSDSFGFDESKRLRNVLRSHLPEDVSRGIWKGELPEEAMDEHIVGGRDLYDFMQALESAAAEHEIEGQDYADEIGGLTLSITGFTASFENMLKIDPGQIAILQLAAKKNAKPHHVVGEMELRFWPEDVRVVRYFKP